MEYRTLGTTGVRVSTHCLGAMMFGSWGNTDVDACVRMVHEALDAGINFVDTADVYSAGESEGIVGTALADRRDEVVLATKVHGRMGPGKNDEGNSRAVDHARGREPACAASAPTTSTSTRSTARNRRPTSTKRWARSRTSSERARSGTSGPRRSPAGSSWRPPGSPSATGCPASGPSSPRTRSSSGRSSSTCSPSRNG